MDTIVSTFELLKNNNSLRLIIQPLNYKDNIWYLECKENTFFFKSYEKNKIEYFKENDNNLFYGSILGGDVLDQVYIENTFYGGSLLIYKFE